MKKYLLIIPAIFLFSGIAKADTLIITPTSKVIGTEGTAVLTITSQSGYPVVVYYIFPNGGGTNISGNSTGYFISGQPYNWSDVLTTGLSVNSYDVMGVTIPGNLVDVINSLCGDGQTEDSCKTNTGYPNGSDLVNFTITSSSSTPTSTPSNCGTTKSLNSSTLGCAVDSVNGGFTGYMYTIAQKYWPFVMGVGVVGVVWHFGLLAIAGLL